MGNLEAGDLEEKTTVTLDAGANTVEGGQAVKFDTNGEITPTAANSDDYVGVVLDVNKGADADNEWPVHVCGQVVSVEIDGAVNAGETLVPSSVTAGRWETHAGGMYEPNPDTAAGAVAANHPFALEDGADGETIRAAFR